MTIWVEQLLVLNDNAVCFDCADKEWTTMLSSVILRCVTDTTLTTLGLSVGSFLSSSQVLSACWICLILRKDHTIVSQFLLQAILTTR